MGTAPIANCPCPLCRAEGQLWHCLVVSSRQAAETNLTLISAPACPCLLGLVRSSLVAPHLDREAPRACSALLSPFSASQTGQTNSELPLLSGTASEHCCPWCIQTPDSIGTGLLFVSTGSRKKKVQNQKLRWVCLSAFEVGIIIHSSLDNKGLAKVQAWAKTLVRHPLLCTWVGCVWDGEEAPKRMMWRGMQNKQKNPAAFCALWLFS